MWSLSVLEHKPVLSSEQRSREKIETQLAAAGVGLAAALEAFGEVAEDVGGEYAGNGRADVTEGSEA